MRDDRQLAQRQPPGKDRLGVSFLATDSRACAERRSMRMSVGHHFISDVLWHAYRAIRHAQRERPPQVNGKDAVEYERAPERAFPQFLFKLRLRTKGRQSVSKGPNLKHAIKLTNSW